ncbi:MAG: thioredoxin domain-containing protein [Ignavibacteriales bacterium]|nr:MAG: thioredoxin domain-containing protein [Ignavibacteriales bacterium]
MKNPNRLINEKSPYLLQHAYNPVDWYAWNEEAFSKAQKEDKPVFLSIGYSTCHWCHVMEKESFEHDATAKIINDVFVPVKVDREERPDIDSIYMTVCQMLTGGGGWPLTIMMTPDKKPFFAGTYFPRSSRYGRPGLQEIIQRISDLWTNNRVEINRSTTEIFSVLTNVSSSRKKETLTEEILTKAYYDLAKSFDEENGGFGTAPKFPSPHTLLFLLRYYKRNKTEKALQIVEKTLAAMRLGGIYDHIGFGFSRYSTDSAWLVPHFEKMLYDQAMLVIAYTETYQLTKNEAYRKTAEEILEYVQRDMLSPEGGFYSAEDADSEGEEGKFYLWKADELKSLLSEEEYELAVKACHVSENGNWIDQVHGGLNGTNILHLKSELGEEEKEIAEEVRKRLFDHREKRIHPHKDDKILTDWNGLMISAFAKASQVFDNKEYYKVAKAAADFLLKNLKDKNGNLLHRYRLGESAISAMLDDYSFLINALIDLYETGFEFNYLSETIRLTDYSLKHFWDESSGGFFFTSDEAEKLLLRQKEFYDGAIPSGNSVFVLNLLRLARLTSKSEYEEKANQLTHSFSQLIDSNPASFAFTLTGLDFAFGPAYEIVISAPDEEKFSEMLRVLIQKYIPNKVIVKHSGKAESLMPYLKYFHKDENKTFAYVCKNYVCEIPADSPGKLISLLEQAP